MDPAPISSRDYLNRIRFPGRPGVDPKSLSGLQRSHLFSVPFENLSIHSRERIRLEQDWLLEKIVRRVRGGFCFECNGAFSWLLSDLGFEVDRLAARVYSEKLGRYSQPFDHMLLHVRLDVDYIVDVGFGEGYRQPLLLWERGDQIQTWGKYRIRDGEDQFIYERWDDGSWKPQYTFNDTPYPLSAFNEMCRYHQTSRDSPFTKNWAASLATAAGRITLAEEGPDARLITTENGGRRETIIMGLDNQVLLLEEMFGLRAIRLDRR